MTKTSWIPTSTATTYVPREKPIQESVAPFSGTISGAAPATTNLGTNSGQRILAADGTWIPQPAFTSGGADQLETLRPSVISPSYSGNPPTVTDSAKAYDVDTNHATTFGQWYAAQEARTNNRVDIFSLTTWASKTQTWTAATINVSRSYAILQDGESSATSGSSSKTSSVKYEFSTDNGSNWTTLGTDTAASIPTAPQTLSMALGSLTPTMGNILVKVTITRGGGGTIYEDGVSLPGLTGEVDLKLFDVWIDGTYAGGAGNITCNNLTVTGDATFQNKIYDSTASAGTTGQVLKVAANGKVTWATDSAGTGTVTSITTTGANGVTISGGSTQTITTSGTFALALGNITPTSISTGTGSFSGDVEFAASIKSPNGSNSPIVISPDGTGDLHVNADSLRLGDNNADATIATNGTGDLILTTHEGSATQGIIRLYDGANGNITLTPNGTGQVQVGSDQVVTLTASQTLTNKSLSGSSNTFTNIPNSATTAASANTASAIVARDASGNFSAGTITATLSGNATNVTGTVAVANGGTGSTTLTSGSYVVGNGTSAVTLKTPTQVTADLDTFTYQIGATAGKKGLVPAAPAIGGSVVYLDQTGSWTTPSGSGTTTNALTIQSPLTGTSFNGSTAVTIGLGTVAVGNGGTGLTSLTAGYIPYGSGTSAFGSSANLFWDSTNSRLGIGTATPADKLQIAAGRILLDQDYQLTWQNAGTNRARMYGDSGNNIIFENGSTNTERMRITSAGQLIIGNGDAVASPTSGTLRGTDGSGTDIAGASLTIQGGRSTGTGTGGSVIFNTTAAAGTTGSSLNAVSERMRISSAGNVGIGTAFPGEKLHIEGNLYFGTTSRTIAQGGSANMVLQVNTGQFIFTSANGATERMRINASGEIVLGNGNTSPTPTNATLRGTDGTGTDIAGASLTIQAGRGTGTGAGGSLLFFTAAAAGTTGSSLNTATEKMRLDSAGNLGLGTASPSAKLHINVSSTSSNQFKVYSNDGTPQLRTYSTSDGDGLIINQYWAVAGSPYLRSADFVASMSDVSSTMMRFFTKDFSSNPAERMRITSAGNVGIGTTNPLARLDIVGDATPAGAGLAFGHANTAGYKWIQTFGSQPLYINPLGNNVVFNRDAGNVGVGTVSPDAKLSVNGVGSFGSGTAALPSIAQFGDLDTGRWSPAANTLAWSTGGSERMRIDSAGILGLGVTPQSWNSIFKAIQIGGSNYYSIASQNSNNSYGSILWNAYGTGDETFAYNKTGDNATRFAQQYDFRWYLAPSGTAGNTITFTQAMTLDASGNLGLNITPRPFNSIFRALQIGSLNYFSIASQNSGSAYGSILWNAYGTGDEAFTYNKTGDKATRFAQQYDFKWFTAPSGTAGSAITFTQVMTLDNSGNLGIGTASPAYKLDVNGTLNASGALTVSGNATFDTNTLFVDATNHRVGMGTTSPINKLTILGSTAASGELGSFAITGSTTAKRLAFGVDSTSTMYGWIQSVESGVGFRDIALQPLGGNLLIGNTTGTEKLTVTGKIKASDVLLGNNGTKGYGAITTTTSTSTPTGGASGDFTLIY